MFLTSGYYLSAARRRWGRFSSPIGSGPGGSGLWNGDRDKHWVQLVLWQLSPLTENHWQLSPNRELDGWGIEWPAWKPYAQFLSEIASCSWSTFSLAFPLFPLLQSRHSECTRPSWRRPSSPWSGPREHFSSSTSVFSWLPSPSQSPPQFFQPNLVMDHSFSHKRQPWQRRTLKVVILGLQLWCYAFTSLHDATYIAERMICMACLYT